MQIYKLTVPFYTQLLNMAMRTIYLFFYRTFLCCKETLRSSIVKFYDINLPNDTLILVIFLCELMYLMSLTSNIMSRTRILVIQKIEFFLNSLKAIARKFAMRK